MYSLSMSTGEAVRLSDGKVVAPCQSADAPDFIAYIDWIYAGNQPTLVE